LEWKKKKKKKEPNQRIKGVKRGLELGITRRNWAGERRRSKICLKTSWN